MIPDNPNIKEITPNTLTLTNKFIFPDNIASSSELEDYELGGVDLQDPSQGLQVKVWKCWWDPDDETVYIQDTETENTTALFVESDVIELAFTFDQNMRWYTATRLEGDVLKFRWFDTAIAQYVTSTYNNITSARLTHDDKRRVAVETGQSDVILTYLRAKQVRWRIQRDRFLQEYTYSGQIYPEHARITHFGMNEVSRLQWRIGMRRFIPSGHCA